MQADALAAEFAAIDGVDDLIWLGDVVDIRRPLETYDADIVKAWKSDEGYLYQVALDSTKSVAALDAIKEAAQAGGANAVALSGDEVNTAVAQGSSDFEIQLILVMAVIVILGLLLLTSEAWFEPVLFLSVIGISIVYNLGTNIIFGEISFITQMCAAILQLAVSMDYGIVMLHEYRHFKQEGCSSYDAALAGMHKASGVIASSAATTFFGFLSLCAMAFLIGADMGVVLAKGIVFSFLSVLFILPVMVLLSEKLLQRTAHRKFLPSFDKFAKWCMRLSIPFTLIAALIVVPAFLGSRNTEYVYGASGFVEPGSQLYEDTELIEETFNASGQCAVLVPEGQWGKEKELVAALDTLPHVSSITSYVTTVSERIPTDMVPPASLESFISGGYSRIIIATDLRGESPEAFELVQRIRDLCQLYYPDEAKLVGSTVTSYDMSLIVNDDSARVLFASSCCSRSRVRSGSTWPFLILRARRSNTSATSSSAQSCWEQRSITRSSSRVLTSTNAVCNRSARPSPKRSRAVRSRSLPQRLSLRCAVRSSVSSRVTGSSRASERSSGVVPLSQHSTRFCSYRCSS